MESAFSLDQIGALDNASYVPLYVQLAERISSLIRQCGERAAGKSLPSESECAQHLKVSRPTVRQAMLHLMREGMVVRQRGRGTFIAPPKISHDMAHGFEDEMQASHRNVRHLMLEWRRVHAPERVLNALGGSATDEVYYLKRLRVVDDVPFGVEERYFPMALGARITRAEAKSQPMLRLLHKVTSESMVEVQIQVTSALASKDVAALLKARKGAPVLTKSLTYLFHGNALAFATTTFLGDDYQFRFQVTLPLT